MNRRDFLKLSGAAVAVAGISGGIRTSATGRPSGIPGLAAEKTDGLKVRFLGTGAADWNGRDERGELRRLTSALIDGHILVDFTPTDRDMIPEGCRPDVIFYTHSHGDHFNAEAATSLGIKDAYFGNTWEKKAKESFSGAAKKLGRPAPRRHPLAVGQSVTIGDVTFTALPANHATEDPSEQTLIYLVEKGDVRLLYATDTGGIPIAAARLAGIDAHIRDGKPVTAIIMEATMGIDFDEDYRIFTHSSVGTVKRIADVLTQTGRYLPKEGQPVYLTHMARTLHGTQAELDATLPSPLKAAYDGLEVIFR